MNHCQNGHQIIRHTTFVETFESIIDGVPENLAGCAFRAQIRTFDGATIIKDLVPTFETDGSNGRFRVLLTPEETGVLQLGQFQWDIMCDYPDGHTDRILPTEPIEIVDPATQPAP